MAEPSNSGGIQAPENFSKYKGSKVTFWPRPASTWVNLVYPLFEGGVYSRVASIILYTIGYCLAASILIMSCSKVLFLVVIIVS